MLFCQVALTLITVFRLSKLLPMLIPINFIHLGKFNGEKGPPTILSLNLVIPLLVSTIIISHGKRNRGFNRLPGLENNLELDNGSPYELFALLL